MEKHIERGDLVAANDDHVQTGVIGLVPTRTGPPREAAGVVERLRLAMRRVCEVRVSRTQVSCELVQCVVPDENAGRHIEDAVIGVELLDCRTTADGVAFTENLLEVAVQQFKNPGRHSATPYFGHRW